MTTFYFDVWASDDLNGTALGELTKAYNRTFQRLDQAIGSGQFTINRHDTQYTNGWCAADNLVRVRLVTGGPFAADDTRYVHAFFIEEGDDEAVSIDEEGGEEITRGGRDAIAILRRAVMNYVADYPGDDVYASKALKDGNWHFLNRNAGNVLRLCLRNASARTPNPLTPMSMDFNTSHDTSGTTWSDSDADWHIPVGQDLLEVLGTLAAGDTFWRMGTDLILHAWDDDPGADVSASVVFTAGDNIRESAQRQVHARETVSRVLVQGTKKDGSLTYRWVSSSSTETLLGGRREGFVEYQATPTNARLDKAGHRAIRSLLKQHDGPTTMGVEERAGDPVAFTHYLPGDSITVDIPGIWNSVVAKVYGIQMDEDEAGDALVTVILEEQPFDPSHANNTDAGLGDGKGSGPGAKCGDCPDQTPFVPGGSSCTDTGAFAAFDGTYSWFFSEGSPSHSPANPNDVLPTFGFADVGSSNYPSPGSPTWYAVRLDRGASPVPVAALNCQMPLGAYEASPTFGPASLIYGPSIWAGDAPGSYSQVVDLPTMRTYETFRPDDPLTSTGVYVNIQIPEAFRSKRYWQFRLDDLFVSDFWPGGGFGFFEYSECLATAQTLPPDAGQPTTEQLAGDGSTTAFQTNYPYEPSSPHVTVNGVLWPVTETTPTTGTFTTASAPPAGAVIVVTYQIASTTGTGATNPQTTADATQVAATQVSIADAGSYFTGTDVEAALQELGAAGGSSPLPFFDVRDYGAVIDGSTDDLAAWQAARDAAAAVGGGVLFHPGGITCWSGTLTISTPHIGIEGVGNEYGPSIIKMTAANTTAINYSASWSDDSWTYHAAVRRILVIGPGTTGSPATSGRGIYSKSHVNLEHVGIVGFYDGLYWDDRTFYSRAYGLFVSSCANAGVVMNGTNNCTLDTCRIFGDDSRTAPTVAGRRIFGAMAYGVRIQQTGTNTISPRVINSTVEYFTNDGIYVDGGYSAVIDGNYFETQQSSSGHAHINIGASTHTARVTSIHGNYFQGDGTSGFDAVKGDKASTVLLTSNYLGINSGIRVNFAGSSAGVIEGANTWSGSPTNVWPSDTIHLGSILADPMTTRGDLMVRNSSNVTARLAVGAANTLLHGGTDPAYSAVVEGDLSLTDITTANVSTTKHGFAPKAPNDVTKFLRGDASWAAVSGLPASALAGQVVAADDSGAAYWREPFTPLTVSDGAGGFELVYEADGSLIMV